MNFVLLVLELLVVLRYVDSLIGIDSGSELMKEIIDSYLEEIYFSPLLAAFSYQTSYKFFIILRKLLIISLSIRWT